MGTIDQESSVVSDRDAIKRLQRGILRLALAYHGQDPQLDGKLKKFGGLIRSGDGNQAERHQLIDQIVDTVISLHGNKPADTATEALPPDGEFEHFLQHLTISADTAPQLAATEQALHAARNRGARLEAVAMAAGTLSTMLSNGASANAALNRRMLLELIERLPLSKGLVAELGPIRRAVERAVSDDDYLACVQSIVTLIEKLRMALQSEVRELEGFIKKIAARLSDFDRFVDRTTVLNNATNHDVLQLSDTIGTEISGLRETVANTDDISALRYAIDDRLDNIGQGLTQFAEAQSARESESNQALDEMTSKLRELESQTENLREDLEKQHARVLRDPLTGVLNRTGYDETSVKHFARWRRYGGKLSMAIIDLDLFKQINDDYGHSAGDRVLATVATRLQEQIRESDVLCRFGGEEFVLLLPETSSEDAEDLLEKLRLDIEQCPFRHKETPVKVTFSCGIAQFHGSDTLEAVFDRADAAMYQAKAAGRNQIRNAGAGDLPAQTAA